MFLSLLYENEKNELLNGCAAGHTFKKPGATGITLEYSNMYARQNTETPRCHHSQAEHASGLAIVTIGNSLRADDGIASALCDQLPHETMVDACRFDLGTYSNYLSECLKGHKAVIIIDSTCDGRSPGSITIVDLNSLLESSTLDIKSTHGFSLLDELKLAKEQDLLPPRLIFFGVEIGEINWKESISPALQEKLPQLVKNLAFLVQKMLEALRKDA